MRNERIPAWLKLVLAAVGLVLAIPALWVLVSVTARPLYPAPEDVPTVMGSAPPPEWAGAAGQARQIVRASVAKQNLPGLSVAVGVGDNIVWAEGFGFADLKTSETVTPDDRFRIGTASTVLTSAAAGRLVENGWLNPDDQIHKYTPDFPDKEWPVTLRQLMANTAGVVSDDDGELFTKHCERPLQALLHFAERPLLFQPGTRYHYSTFGWILASLAVEYAADEPLLKFMQEQIFDPLGMRNTAPDPAVEPDDDFPPVNLIRELIYDPRARRGSNSAAMTRPAHGHVTSYHTRFGSDPKYGMHVMRSLDYSCYAGASSFVSTPSDLVRFALAMQSGKLLHADTVEMLQTSQRLTTGEETGHGLGWYVRTLTIAGKQKRVLGQDGDSFGGMVASLMTIPEDDIVVAVTSNIPHSDTFSIAARVAGAFTQNRSRAAAN